MMVMTVRLGEGDGDDDDGGYLGSWSTSPMSRSLAWSGMAASMSCISSVSIMLASSTITKSHSKRQLGP